MPDPITAFCSYSWSDKARVLAITERLAAAGIHPWLDKWEIQPGHSFIARINEGLRSCDVGVLFWSQHAQASRWVQQEMEALLRQAVEEGKPLLLVMLDSNTPMPPLLGQRLRLNAEDVDTLIDAIYQRVQRPTVAAPRWTQRDRQCQILVQETSHRRLQVQATLDGAVLGEPQEVQTGADFAFSYQEFLRVAPHGSRVSAEERASQRERDLTRLGQALGQALLPGSIGTGLTAALHEARSHGDSLTVVFETAQPAVLALPFEAVRLADGRVLALEPGVRLLRRLTQPGSRGLAPLPGPLRLLVAVGAPDEGQTANVVLDHEHELQTVLDAVDQAQQHSPAEVRILEVAHPQEIQRALTTQRYHVLHLSGHGTAGRLELEDEEGQAVPVTATELVDAMQRSGHRVPLVVLAACHSGAGNSDTVSLAQGLLQHGVPLVLAMQSSVSDWYATRLVGALYRHLSSMAVPLVSHALALARQEVEAERQSAQPGRRWPAEYATPSLFCAGPEYPLLDRTLPQPAPPAPVLSPVASEVPRLSLGDLIGRRAILRRVLRVLRDEPRTITAHGAKAGVLLSGLGGVGKSALAGRVMQRLSTEGWTPLAVVGRWGLGDLCLRLGAQLFTHQDTTLARLGELLLRPELPDAVRQQLLQQLLAQHRVLLVLDNAQGGLMRFFQSDWEEKAMI